MTPPVKAKFRALFNGILIALILLLVYGAYGYSSKNAANNQSAPVRSIGTATVGGPFQMTGSDDQIYSQKDFAGKYMLLYFGYTYCPDVCPLDLQRLTLALDSFAAGGGDISNLQPLFVTIDPARDTPQVMAEYITHFHPSILGLSGTDAQLADMAKAYKVYYQQGDVYEDGSYLMDHSSIMYLMGPEGEFVTHISSNEGPKAFAEKLLRFLP